MDENPVTQYFDSGRDWTDAARRPAPRPFVGVLMKCCRTYVRAYLNPAQDAFVGWCPRCAAKIEIEAVEEGGSTSRFFEAS
jgi:hypothetical protein